MRKQEKQIEYGPENDSTRMHGYRNVRWVENVSRGLRLVGFADEVAKRDIDHKGWFIHDDDGMSGEVYRGVVYQLPARHGLPQYVYGYDDPYNDDCALLCFDVEETACEAARQADRFAEIFAEYERDYDQVWQARRRYDDLADEIKALRTEALTLGKELRAAKKSHIEAPTICEVLRDKIKETYWQIQKMRKERKDLFNDFGTCEGFSE